MTDLFQNVLGRGLDVSWLVLAVIAVRRLLKRSPKWIHCGLWALVALRLVCPVSVESSLSLVPSREAVMEEVFFQDAAGEESIETIPQEVPVLSEPEPIPQAHYTPPYQASSAQPAPEPEAPFDWLRFGSLVWMAGMGILLVYSSVSYGRLRRKTAASLVLEEGVFLCDYIDTPFLLGVFRPGIYLPSDLTVEDRDYVLAHERAHLARRDHWWKPLGFGLLILYWFHPLLWAAYFLFSRDLELACDERVVRDWAPQEKKVYSHVLLKCSVPGTALAACPLAFGEVGVTQRIRSIANYRRPGFWILTVSAAVLALVAVCFGTDPKAHTLYDLMDLPVQEIDAIDLWSQKGRVTYSGESLQQVLDLFEALEYDPEPLSQEPIPEDHDEDLWSYWFAEIQCGEEVTKIYSDYDRTMIWVIQPDGTIGLPYALKEPEVLQDYLAVYVTPVLGRYVTMDAYATAAEPGLWLQKVSPEAISAARLWTVLEDQTLDTKYLSGKVLPELVGLLNTIPENALGEMQTDPEFTYDDLRYFVTGENKPENFQHTTGVFLLLEDGACDVTALLRSYNGKAELLLIEDFNWQTNHEFVQPGYARCWTLDNQELQDYLLNLKDRIPTIWTWVGSRHAVSREYTRITDGKTTISTHFLMDWDYEILEPGGQSFGFRCRPKDESVGWVYFEWWEHSFPASAEEEKAGIRGRVGSCQADVYRLGPWDNYDYERQSCPHGDFVIRKDKEASWQKKYWDILSDIEIMTDVQCTP